MGQKEKKKQQAAAQKPKKPNRTPKPRHPRGHGAKVTAEIVVSLLLVAFAGYEVYRIYDSMVPIAQGSGVVAGGDSDEADDSSSQASTDATVYENVAVEKEAVHEGDLILVNNDNAYVPSNETEITSIYEYKEANQEENYHVSGTDVSLRKPALEALSGMLDDFYKATGHQDIIIISGYRTTEEQQALYDSDLSSTGEDSSTLVALPGHSEHESGYSVDLSLYSDGNLSDYDGTGDYAWIDENCDHYGYILRYTEAKTEETKIRAEAWHYRYVGEPHATYMKENNLCLEEYLTLLRNYTTENHLKIVNWDGEIYEVYYVPADTTANTSYVLVPPDKDYTISGNNSDGFIVTVDTGEIQKFDDESSADSAADGDSSAAPEETAAPAEDESSADEAE
ncbi:M15 family metallopeptidase [Ruminococcus sp.]